MNVLVCFTLKLAGYLIVQIFSEWINTLIL